MISKCVLKPQQNTTFTHARHNNIQKIGILCTRKGIPAEICPKTAKLPPIMPTRVRDFQEKLTNLTGKS